MFLSIFITYCSLNPNPFLNSNDLFAPKAIEQTPGEGERDVYPIEAKNDCKRGMMAIEIVLAKHTVTRFFSGGGVQTTWKKIIKI